MSAYLCFMLNSPEEKSPASIEHSGAKQRRSRTVDEGGLVTSCGKLVHAGAVGTAGIAPGTGKAANKSGRASLTRGGMPRARQL